MNAAAMAHHATVAGLTGPPPPGAHHGHAHHPHHPGGVHPHHSMGHAMSHHVMPPPPPGHPNDLDTDPRELEAFAER